MINLNILTTIAMIFWGCTSMAQQLSTPEVIGTQTGTSMTVSFPFTINGVPFSQIRGSVWDPNAHVVAELYMSYYLEGDATKYSVTKTISANISDGGGWQIPNITTEPKAYHISGKKMVQGKTYYSLFIHQRYNGQRSHSWNAELKRSTLKVWNIPNQNLEPKVTSQKEKVSLNPQPIPPQTNPKPIKIRGF